MKVMKPKVCLFVRAGLYRGSRGFWKRPYGRPEGPNRYGTLAKLKAMVRISKSRSPPPNHPNHPNPGSEDGVRSVAVEKKAQSSRRGKEGIQRRGV